MTSTIAGVVVCRTMPDPVPLDFALPITYLVLLVPVLVDRPAPDPARHSHLGRGHLRHAGLSSPSPTTWPRCRQAGPGPRQIPPAVLAAIVLPALLRPEGYVDLLQPRLLAGALAALVAWRTRNVGLTLVWASSSRSKLRDH